MKYQIKRGLSTIITLRPEGVVEERVMAVNISTLSFELPVLIEFKIGDYVEIDGGLYYIVDPQPVPVQKESSIRFSYELKFKRKFYDLMKSKYFTYGDDNELKETDFTLTGTAEFFIDLMIKNVHRIDVQWEKGSIQPTNTLTLTFSNENCLQVLSRLAEAFKTEFWITQKTIHLTKLGSVVPITLEYGKGKGLYSIQRTYIDESAIITVLYARGSTRNLPADYRGFSKRLQMPVGTPYLENNVVDEFGDPKYGIIEESINFEEIYPRRTGTITGVLAYNKFVDTGIDFNINDQLLEGISAKVTFNTGKLAGYTFEIQKAGYDHTAKSIIINQNSDEKAISVPSVDFAPEAGDQYVITDIKMPTSYITAAELELKDAAQLKLDELSNPRISYKVVIDPLHFKRNNIKLELGSYIRIKDTQFGVDKNIRIIGFTRNLQDLYQYPELDLAETVNINRYVREISKSETIDKAISLNKLTDPFRARLNWRTGQELLNQYFDPDGKIFTEAITPLTIRTLMIQIGSPSQQLEMPGVVFQSNYEQDTNKVNWTAGKLVHATIEAMPRTWTITGGTVSGLDPTKGYYVYAKCEKLGDTGTVIFEETEITVDQDPNYFHFWIGFANSVIDSYRTLKMLYGSVLIYGRTIEGGRILGNLLDIDLDAGTIRGKVQMLDGSYTEGVLVVGENGDGNAFISGITLPLTPGESVRFGAGGEYGDPDLPFKVLDDGTLYTSKLIAEAGTIAGFAIDGNGLTNQNGDAFISVKKVSGSNSIGASMGSGIDSSSFWGIPAKAAGVFVNTIPGSDDNVGIYVDVTNSSGGGGTGRALAMNINRGTVLLGKGSIFVAEKADGSLENAIDTLTIRVILDTGGAMNLTFTNGLLTRAI